MAISLSTEDVTLRERLSYWNFMVSRVLGRLEMSRQQSCPFTGTISYSKLSSIPIATVASSQLSVLRPERFISDPHEDFYKVNFHLQGQVTLRQYGRTVRLEPDHWVIYDNTRPYELQFHSTYQQLLLLVPRQQLLNLIPSVEGMLAQPLSCQHGSSKVLLEFARSTLQQSESISPLAAAQMREMLLQLLSLGLAEQSNAAPSIALNEQSRVLQVKQFIATHLHDPALSIEMIAQALHLSKRHLHSLFEQAELTVTRYIWQQRLEKSAHDLANPYHLNRTISQIAFSWGFNSSAHFSRLFKKQYGITPRQYRQQQKALTPLIPLVHIGRGGGSIQKSPLCQSSRSGPPAARA